MSPPEVAVICGPLGMVNVLARTSSAHPITGYPTGIREPHGLGFLELFLFGSLKGRKTLLLQNHLCLSSLFHSHSTPGGIQRRFPNLILFPLCLLESFPSVLAAKGHSGFYSSLRMFPMGSPGTTSKADNSICR